MNRISLYEAIRRQKEKQGLNPPPKTGPVPDKEQRNEPALHLKPLPAQKKTAVPVKPAVKSPIKPPLAAKSSFLRKEKKESGQFAVLVRNFVKHHPATTWVGIGGGIVILVLVIFLLSVQRGQNLNKQAQENVLDNKVQPNTIAGQPATNQPPAVSKQDVKPAVEKTNVIDNKQAETPKAQPKVQLPAVIQEQLQKQAEAEKPEPPKPVSTGDHVIVIATYTKQEHLLPVQAYFNQNGIETEIIKQGSYYQLVTKQRFENPERAGTDGYKMKQTIKRVGANYKAPDGFKFDTTPFQDVYGKKVK